MDKVNKMIDIINNKHNLKEEDINKVVKRVKALIINSSNEILLGYSYHTYQFPGGHVEGDEPLIHALNREIREETGMVLNIKNIKPFARNIGYHKDLLDEGYNVKTEIYYYEIKTDEKPDLYNTNYTDEEEEGNFKLKYISLDEVGEALKKNVSKWEDAKGIAEEMLTLLDLYKTKIVNNC